MATPRNIPSTPRKQVVKKPTKITDAGTEGPARKTLAPGDAAPDFALVADDGTTVRLADFTGRPLVVYFYPKDDTPGCTREACAFRDGLGAPGALGALGALGAGVVGISRDGTAAHQRFKAKYGLNFPLLSDTDTEVHRAYGAWGTKTMYGKAVTGAIRATVLIDGQGRVARAWPNVKVDGHAEAVRAAIAAMG